MSAGPSGVTLEALPDDLVFRVNYLGGDMPTFALNFSRPGAQIVASTTTSCGLVSRATGAQQECRDMATYVSGAIAELGPFEPLPTARSSSRFQASG